jgi:nucleoside 2-deoxyribosyltransferase
MLQDEYVRIAKSVDNLSEGQAKQIIGTVLDKLKAEVGAIIVDVWLLDPGQGGVDILVPYLRRSDPQVPGTQKIALTDKATGLLVWVAETRKPVWLDDIPVQATSALNRLTGQPIEGRHFNLYDGTRAFAAVPSRYRGQFAILTVEVAVANCLKNYHIDLMKALSEPTGILIWKSGVSEEIRRHTNEAIQEFRDVGGGLGPTLNPYRTGFIARPFDQKFDYISNAIEAVFRRNRIRAATYRSLAGSTLVVSEMLNQINSAHFGIADITSLNSNVLFEVGAMIAVRKPLVIMRSKSDDAVLPFDIAGYDCYRYAVTADRIVILDATSQNPLEEFVGSFISRRLQSDKAFRDAIEYV